MLSFYRELITLRQNYDALVIGDYKPVYADKQSLAYIRCIPRGNEFLIVLNLSHRPCYLNIEHMTINGTIIFSTSPELHGTKVTARIQLSGDEGIIVELSSNKKL